MPEILERKGKQGREEKEESVVARFTLLQPCNKSPNCMSRFLTAALDTSSHSLQLDSEPWHLGFNLLAGSHGLSWALSPVSTGPTEVSSEDIGLSLCGSEPPPAGQLGCFDGRAGSQNPGSVSRSPRPQMGTTMQACSHTGLGVVIPPTSLHPLRVEGGYATSSWKEAQKKKGDTEVGGRGILQTAGVSLSAAVPLTLYCP